MSLLQHRLLGAGRQPVASHPRAPPPTSRRRIVGAAADQDDKAVSTLPQQHSERLSEGAAGVGPDFGKELNRFTRQTASTFAPRSSTATKNPAVKGSALYNVFEAQAWISLVVGGLLSYNIIYPSDQPDIARLLGMWSIWMFTIPSLRAKECTPREKDALNVLFVGVPLLNILLPFAWKSFAFIFTADVLAVAGVYWWKGVWQEVYGLPFAMQGALDGPPPGSTPADGSSGEGEQEVPKQ